MLIVCTLLLSASLASTSQAGQSGTDGRAALEAAAALVQQARFDEAEQQARAALADPATQAVAYSILGTIRFQQSRLADSATFLRRAVALEPRLLGANLSLAQVYVLQGKPSLARPLFDRVLKADPSNAAARLGLARLETEKGNHRQSLVLAEPAMAAFKQSPEGILTLATNYLETKNGDAARALVSDWFALGDVPQEWSVKLAVLLASHGAATESIAVLERAAKTAPASYELAFNLAGAYLVNNEPARALETYDAALAAKPDAVPALRQAAGLAERQGELERSLSYWMRAKKIQPNDPDVLLGFGRVCLKMDLLEDAEPALAKAAELKPDDTAYQYTLAAAKVGKRQFEAAQHLLERMVAKRPGDALLQYGLGSVLYAQGQLSDAAARLNESLRLHPGQLAARYYLALVARDQGNDAEAMGMLEQMLREYPDHAAGHEVLGSLLMAKQQYPAAEDHLKKAVRLNPKGVKANYQLGLLLARMGRKEEADRQLEFTKTLRQEDEANSRLQLRLVDPDQ